MVSIIIPIYKAEKSIRRCIDSVLSQTYKDWELVLVDDGSPDKSGVICDEYQSKDSRIRVIHKPNGGVSSARNKGLDEARGEWISFVDADDWVSPSFLEDMLHSNADIIACGYDCTEAKTVVLEAKFFSTNDVSDCVEEIMFNNPFYTPWAKLFRRDLIERYNIRFDHRIRLGEDTCFCMDAFYNATTIEYIQGVNYHYEGNPSDLSKYILTWDEAVYFCKALCQRLLRMEARVNRKFRFTRTTPFSRFIYVDKFFETHTDSECRTIFFHLIPNSTYASYYDYVGNYFVMKYAKKILRGNLHKVDVFLDNSLITYFKYLHFKTLCALLLAKLKIAVT